MPNLIESSGASYITEFAAGAHFFYEGKLLRLLQATDEHVICADADTGDSVNVPVEFFTGWRVFAAGPAGYRRLSEHVVGYCSRHNSTRRGIRADSVRVEYTPATLLLSRIRTGGTPAVSNTDKVRAFIAPTYDNIDVDLPRLLNGEILTLVLNENLIIEPAVGLRADAWYSIIYKQAVIGKLNRQGRVTWNDPEQSVLIPSLQAA